MELPVGRRHGCFTIIGGTDVYQNGPNSERIVFAIQMRQKYVLGELEPDTLDDDILMDTSTHKGINRKIIETENALHKYIEDLKAEKGYKIQCKCGKCFYVAASDKPWWLRKRFRYCGEDCGIKAEHVKRIQASYKRERDDSWYLKLENTLHESLAVGPCISDDYEKLYTHSSRLQYGEGTFKVYKQYRCKCYLCGKEWEFISSDFEIKKDYYGRNAEKGYYSNACCDCHIISSFQWRTIKILKENNIPYRVEVKLQGLTGIDGYSKLKFDFAIYNSDGTPKCLIECQGIQHYKPVEEFGGQSAFEVQVQNDSIKRKYVEKHNLILIEIPYTCNTYEKEMKFLRANGVI